MSGSNGGGDRRPILWAGRADASGRGGGPGVAGSWRCLLAGPAGRAPPHRPHSLGGTERSAAPGGRRTPARPAVILGVATIVRKGRGEGREERETISLDGQLEVAINTVQIAGQYYPQLIQMGWRGHHSHAVDMAGPQIE
ncbi:uncharacterized protein A4U43_C05F20100 [Asparagus officinalis]|uniref:Uncharacterized protein n=1 Tax=Asparagus officinalis TaxID=4686 RepID=A0A5P1EU30_ASPOF|nr:uncharacterized protein A4U43_C05F20100 [Asparagus officinalis]